jgi:hypothetical protein
MYRRAFVLLVMGLLVVNYGFAKKKTKSTMPAYVLNARTVAVMIDPDAGVSVDDPRANEVAQKDVETALANWGRFAPQLSTQGVDLIIVVRKGHERLVNETINDPRQNSRPGSVNTTDNGISVGAQHGQPSNGDASADSAGEASHPQMEIGDTDDTFTVYEGGGSGDVLSKDPAWRYVAKDGLRSHSVPAVDAFREAVAEADKAAAAVKKP